MSIARPTWLRAVPRTLGSRLFLILLAGLVLAQGLSFAVLFLERTMTATQVMLGTLESDVATSIGILDRVPASLRPDLVQQLDRPTYRFLLGPGLAGESELTGRRAEIAARIREAVAGRLPVSFVALPGEGLRMQAQLRLSDGSPLTVDVHPAPMRIAQWLPYVLAAQLALLILCSWLAVRQAIRPLVRFARAADALDPNKNTPRLNEAGPSEVADAAAAFNAMRDRIAGYLEERVRILAAISHDLQTPITRMKLRADLAEDTPEKEKLLQDLGEIERLVKEGIAYARSAHGDAEKPTRLDIGSFVESLAYDYQDTGAAVSAGETAGGTVLTRPHALRRILTNLIDNALKFAGEAEISVARDAADAITIKVLDRGPGIPEDELENVVQPFFRLEQSRNRGTGGTGLGLAIAHQLALAIGGSLRLRNREGGGLSAELSLPARA